MRMTLAAAVAAATLAAGAARAQSADEAAYDCLLEPHREVELSFSISGIVREVAVERGNRVTSGQAVARLVSEVERVNIELNKAKVAFAERKVQRSQELLKDEFVSEYDVDEAVTELRIAELELQQSQETMRLRSLFSPTAGVVTETAMSAGEFVTEEDYIRVAQISPLNVEVIVPVAAFGTIETGMEAMVYPEEPIGGEHPAIVTIVDTVVDAASGTFGVRLELPNNEFAIPAGLKCRVVFGGS